jgi:hypothetical protein
METIQAWFDGSCSHTNPGGTARYGIVVKVNGETVYSDAGVVGTGSQMSVSDKRYQNLLHVALYRSRWHGLSLHETDQPLRGLHPVNQP